MTRTLRRLLPCLAAGLALAAFPAAASADLLPIDPVTEWETLLPGLSTTYDPADPHICNSGRPQCVDAVAREMTRRLNPLATSCDHNALFSLLYLDVTKQVGVSVRTAGYFQDPGFISHEDAVFASYYFKAFDAYKRTDPLHTPLAWQIAFDAAKNHEVQGIGNLLLGMNAHINRDLPFVLYSIGLTDRRTGASRKPDHDRVNQVLYQAYDPAIAEGARRFDPSLSQYTGPNARDSGIQSVIAWREQAWRNAERLAWARSDAERAQITQQIEEAAALQANTLKIAYAYGPTSSSAARDSFCAVHHYDP
jgi:hypothetical protein